MILQFCKLNNDPDNPKQMHIPIGYAWQESPTDLHIQFGTGESGSENFFAVYDEKKGVYLIRHMDEILEFGHISFQDEPSKGSELLLKTDFEKFWFSPNLTYVTAVVNGKKRWWLEDSVMTHADVVLLAYPKHKYKPEQYLVKYKGSSGVNPNGILLHGHQIPIGKTPILLTTEKIN